MALNPFLIQTGIQAGGALLGRLVAGRRPDMGDYIPQQDIMAELGNIQREQFRQASTALALGSRRAVEDLKAAGITGSGLGAGLSGVFNAAGDTLNSLSAQQADQRIQAKEREIGRETALGLQDYQSDMDARAARAEGVAQLTGSIGDYFSAGQLAKDMDAAQESFFERMDQLEANRAARAQQQPGSTPPLVPPQSSISVFPGRDGLFNPPSFRSWFDGGSNQPAFSSHQGLMSLYMPKFDFLGG